jgi:CrcB protein
MNMSLLLPFIAVAAGGALGAVVRFCVYKTVDTSFPWATIIVNISGCLVASYLMFRYGIDMDNTLRTFLFVGIFGAFTTMSTFSIDMVNLLTAGSYSMAAAHFLLNSAVCVATAFGGRYLALL